MLDEEGGASSIFNHSDIYHIGRHIGCLTAPCLIAGVPGEAVRADADEGGAGAGHTGAAVSTHVHLAEVTCTHTHLKSVFEKS